MSFFGKILDRLGLSPAEAAPAAADETPAPAPPSPSDVPGSADAPSAEPSPAPVSVVDVKELATELGCTTELMRDSAQMNMWLHKTVLQKIADNGGNIPAELLD